MVPFKIAYREHGEGPITILLHGYAGSPMHWDEVALRLSTKYKVVVPNLSHISMGKEKISFSAQVDLICLFLKYHYPLQVVRVAGISYGAALAWGLAIRYPELIEKIVFINPMPPYPVFSFASTALRLFFSVPMGYKVIYLFLRSPLGKKFIRQTASVFRNLSGNYDEERLANLEGRRLHFVCHLLYKFSWILRNERWELWERKLDFWTHDCLLIYEKKDPLFKVEFYESFARLLATDKVCVTEDAGHISIMNQPSLIAHAITDFFENKFIEEEETNKASNF